MSWKHFSAGIARRSDDLEWLPVEYGLNRPGGLRDYGRFNFQTIENEYVEKTTTRAGIVPRDAVEIKCISLLKLGYKYLNEIFNLDPDLLIGRKVDWGNDTIYAGTYNAQTNLVVINLRRLRGHSMMTIFSVLDHELRHAVQYQQGWLNRDFGGRIFHSSSNNEFLAIHG